MLPGEGVAQPASHPHRLLSLSPPPLTPTPPIAAICHHLAPLSPPPFSSGPDESASVLLGWLVSANVASCSEEVLQLLGGTACIFSLLPDFPEIFPVCERAGRCCVACCVAARLLYGRVVCGGHIVVGTWQGLQSAVVMYDNVLM